ncbi:MAG: DUF1501 domain-containing protein [Pirellulaceae bacterium]|nr:DUF1501 domain-containing protein [Pirellulaceae bacterium]MCU0980643.1 DUF1501 domain-containing protein [Pirellulaceae bacterium]
MAELVGGGIRGGHVSGATDQLGYSDVENVVQVRDLHATLARLLGMRQEQFTVKYLGLDMPLTGVEKARVLDDVMA